MAPEGKLMVVGMGGWRGRGLVGWQLQADPRFLISKQIPTEQWQSCEGQTVGAGIPFHRWVLIISVPTYLSVWAPTSGNVRHGQGWLPRLRSGDSFLVESG